MTARAIIAAFAAFTISTAPAYAVTAADYIERFNDDQRFAYINGAIDSMVYGFAKDGQGEKAQCVMSWYFQTPGTPEAVAQAFASHGDLPAAAILRTLADRACR